MSVHSPPPSEASKRMKAISRVLQEIHLRASQLVLSPLPWSPEAISAPSEALALPWALRASRSPFEVLPASTEAFPALVVSLQAPSGSGAHQFPTEFLQAPSDKRVQKSLIFMIS